MKRFTSTSIRWRLIAAVAVTLLSPSTASAGTWGDEWGLFSWSRVLSAGDILVVDGTLFAVFRVDPTTGKRTIISAADRTSFCTAAGVPFACCTGDGTGDGTPPCAVGSGPDFFVGPASVVVESSGDILVTDPGVPGITGAVFRVDPLTGNRTIISAADRTSFCTAAGVPFACCTGDGTGDGTPPCAAVGSGPDFDGNLAILPGNLGGLVVESSGDIMVNSDALFRMDPLTGNRTIISVADRTTNCFGAGLLFACCTGAGTGDGTPPCAAVGSGPDFGSPAGLVVESSGDILVTGDALFRVDPTTGNRTIISGPVVGSGPDFEGNPAGLVVESSGDILVATTNNKTAVFRVDPTTGTRTIVSTADLTSVCFGVRLPFPCCTGFGTGDGTPPCAPGVGSGPAFGNPAGLVVESSGDIVLTDAGRVSPFVPSTVFRVDPTTGNRTIFSGANRITDCVAAGNPFACCTGLFTGDGTPPCAPVGSGPAFDELRGIAIVPFDVMEVPAGTNVSDSALGGSTVPGGIDFTFDDTTGGTITAEFVPAPVSNIENLIKDPGAIKFGLPTDPLQLWEINYSETLTDLLTLVFRYEVLNLAPGFTEDQFAIYQFHAGAWFRPSQTIDTLNKTITVVTSVLSQFALGADVGTSSAWAFSGTAQGGTIDFTVGAVFLSVTTTAGQTAAQVAAAVGAAINADPTLSAGGVTATASGTLVTVDGGVITSTTINDPGIGHQSIGIPALSGPGLILFLLLTTSVLLAIRRRSGAARRG